MSISTVIITRYTAVCPTTALLSSTARQLAKRDGHHCPDRMERISMSTFGRPMRIHEAFSCLRAAKAVL